MKTLELFLSLAIIVTAAALIWHLLDFSGLIHHLVVQHYHDILKREGFADCRLDVREDGNSLIASLCVCFKDGTSVTRDYLRADGPLEWNIKNVLFDGTLGTYRTLVSCCAEHRRAVQA